MILSNEELKKIYTGTYHICRSIIWIICILTSWEQNFTEETWYVKSINWGSDDSVPKRYFCLR